MSRSFRGLTGLVASLTAACIVASACSGSSGGEKTGSTSTVTVAQATDPTSLDPMQGVDVPSLSVLLHLYDPLLSQDPQDPNKLIPDLAKKWERVNPTTYRFTLNTDATFDDGAKLTAADVKYSVDYTLGLLPNRPPTTLSKYFPGLKSAKVVSPSEVDISTATPDPLMPARMSRMLIIKDGAVAKSADALAAEADGTGPYRLVRWDRNQQVVLAARDDYFRGAAKIKNVTFRTIPDAASRVSAIQSGAVDLITGLPADNVAQVKSSIDVKTSPSSAILEVWLNTLEKGPLQNGKVRLALNYAVNMNEIVTNLMSGNGIRIATVAPSYFSDSNQDVKPLGSDPAKAKQLLAQAGYPNGFSMTMMVPTDRYPFSSDIAQALIQQLGAVGVKLKVQSVDFGTFVNAVRSHKIPDAFLAAQTEILFSTVDFMMQTVLSTGAFSWYKNPQVDALLGRAKEELDAAKRKELVTQVQNLLLQDPPFIFGFAYKSIYGVAKNLNWKPAMDDTVNLYSASLRD